MLKRLLAAIRSKGSSRPRNPVLAAAASQVGVVERGGPNRGPEVETYLKTTGNPPGDPWCASFVAWCGKTGQGKAWPLKRTASCQELYRDAKSRGMLQKHPLPNDILIVFYPSLSRYAHTGFVEAVEGNQVATIEGNTNPNGGREGYGVFRRKRTITPRMQFIRWWAPTPSPSHAPQ